MNNNKPYILFGAGGHGMVISEILLAAGMNIKGFFDDRTSKKEVLGCPVFNALDTIRQLDHCCWIISIGSNEARKRIAVSNQFIYGTALHPKSYVSPSAIIGIGSVVMAGVSINAKAQIGQHCILNTGANIDHECVLEDFVHVSPGASLAGNVTVGEGTHIGTGASVIPGVRIGKWCIIGAGAAVIRDVPDFTTVVGVPARILKTEKTHE